MNYLKTIVALSLLTLITTSCCASGAGSLVYPFGDSKSHNKVSSDADGTREGSFQESLR